MPTIIFVCAITSDKIGKSEIILKWLRNLVGIEVTILLAHQLVILLAHHLSVRMHCCILI